MKEYNFSCPNCDESFVVELPEETSRGLFTECDILEPKSHNMTQVSECTNCGQKNTVFYCTAGHPPTEVVGD